MPTIALNISSDPVPTSFCAITNDNWQFLVALLHVMLSGDPNFNRGNAKPPPDKRGLPWDRLNSDGTPDRWYEFAAGQWLSPHRLPPDFVGIYAGDPSLIPTFDGGNANPVSLYDGPFWEALPNSDGRFLVGAGITPAPDSTTLTVGTMSGEEKHALTIDELAPHTHPVVADAVTNPKVAITVANHLARESNFDGAGSPFSYSASGTPTDATLGLSGNAGGNGATPNVVTRHNNMPPYLVVTYIRRTARKFYSIPA